MQRNQLPTTTVCCLSFSKNRNPADDDATVLTLGAGVQWIEAYQAAQQRDRVIVGGISARGSVGAAGGWLQGGGHSVVSPNYGLGKANLL